MVIYRREFSILSVMFSNGRVTHLRDLDARDGFVIIRKQRVMFMREGKVPTKSKIVSVESEIVLVKSRIVSVESNMVSLESGSVSEWQENNYELININ
jgi:hypothetical protein